MSMTNHERVGKALDLLRAGLAPFVEREFRDAFGDDMPAEVARFLDDDRLNMGRPAGEWDVAALLKVMWESWNEVFRRTLGFAERSLVSELRGWRNRWAHQEAFSSDDADRALDSAERLLTAVSAPQAEEVHRIKMDLRRLVFDEQVRAERRRLGGSLIGAGAAGALRPWREVAVPHPDVRSGRYQQAEFAADLWQVHLGEGSDEYRDPVEFFRRTYLTDSLGHLLTTAVARLSGAGGDPVVQLQTNFGGGKTHSMLALYHLFSGHPPTALPGVETVMRAAGVAALPAVRRVVLVGNRLSPGNPVQKSDGTVVRTLWGELAWQVGGREAYDRIRADDERATSPGDRLREIFRDYGPCLVLIDEWVAYARQLHDASDLPGGSFETQFTFAQALTESARAVSNCLVVVSLPASEQAASPHARTEDEEVGGLRGREALDRLRNVIGRVESSWRPASAEESFEIVRRRLFEPFSDPEQFTARDVVALAFADLYRAQRGEFPPECCEAGYEQRLKAAYPIHPEVFDRLYGDWSTLLTFQRTRGVLRLMASVIHSLWDKGDRSPLILPSSIPMDDPRVQFEITRYLSDNWVPVIEKDVDGPGSLPVRLDAEVDNLGRYSACRRVARTVYFGSAPVTGAAHRGLEDRRVRLGCVMPGESPANFGDALRRLAAAATYLYQDGNRYWYATQPTVTKLAEDRAEQLRREPDKVAREVERRVRQDVRQAGDFSRVHPFPQGNADVPDDLEARLVVLDTSAPHARGDDHSAALRRARDLLDSRGGAPRIYRNTLVFLTADQARLQDLEAAVRLYLAWDSILGDREALNLAPQQVRQAETQRQAADHMVTARLPETYMWLLVPVQVDPNAEVTWQALRLQGGEGLAVRASKCLRKDELLLVSFAGTRLRMELDRVPLWRGDHVEVRQLIEDFARYLYLPRLKGPDALRAAIRDGVGLITWGQDSFAYADFYDESSRRYRGLRGGQALDHILETGLVVKPDVARRQMDQEEDSGGRRGAQGTGGSQGQGGGTSGSGQQTGVSEVQAPHRFHGSVRLDPVRAGADAGRVVQEVLAHLVGSPDTNVCVTLEIEATSPRGFREDVVRIVTENARTLRFTVQGFERE
ncbi:MAG TPA: Swt1 family HEPN domain-containing protein [Myxococcota bacterium]|nr:Swt1 family HEPN domain-containing protein [Myxococcota bacterium]HQK50629.1 Swt1 family HEPN domain-containing protein [Myxococcota bacterium]